MFPVVAATAVEADLDSSRENMRPCCVGNEHTHQCLIIKSQNKTSFEQKCGEDGFWLMGRRSPGGPLAPSLPFFKKLSADISSSPTEDEMK